MFDLRIIPIRFFASCESSVSKVNNTLNILQVTPKVVFCGLTLLWRKVNKKWQTLRWRPAMLKTVLVRTHFEVLLSLHQGKISIYKWANGINVILLSWQFKNSFKTVWTNSFPFTASIKVVPSFLEFLQNPRKVVFYKFFFTSEWDEQACNRGLWFPISSESGKSTRRHYIEKNEMGTVSDHRSQLSYYIIFLLLHYYLFNVIPTNVFSRKGDSWSTLMICQETRITFF